MKIVVCVKEINGEINPFDECALECALNMNADEIYIVCMGRMRAIDPLKRLSRLGLNIKVHLLCDNVFAGSDTLATSYVLSEDIKKIAPDLIICGRQSIDGDTGQVGPCLSEILGYSLITNIMEIKEITDTKISAKSRMGDESVSLPAVICVDRINNLRFPRIGQKEKEIEIIDAKMLGVNETKCGLKGSPTQVVKSFQNETGKRKCKFITPKEFKEIFEAEVKKERKKIELKMADKKLENVWAIGDKAAEIAKTIGENIFKFSEDDIETISKKAKNEKVDAILFPANFWGRKYAPLVQVRLNTGLCADCTLLETDGLDLFMYRPALGGDVIAKIKCTTKPAMATVRISENTENDVIISVGRGAKNVIGDIKKYAEENGFGFGASRPVVDMEMAKYENQVGLTGKNVNPKVYVAIGIEGLVQHTCAIEKAGCIIAVNPNKDAKIFDFCDYGILSTAEEFLKYM